MVAQYMADLTRGVSKPRLEKYRPEGGTDLDMAVAYIWNMTLAEALTLSLSALEVSLRNSTHDALTARYGTERWFYHRDFTDNRALGQELSRALGRLDAPTARPSAGRIVAELHFFYWTVLLSGYYHRQLWNPNRAALLRAVFPHLVGQGFQRHLIYDRYNTIRILRNRVVHHEPVLFGFSLPGQATIGLDLMHGNIIDAIGWVNPALQASVALMDRFPAVWSTGEARVRVALQQYLGIT